MGGKGAGLTQQLINQRGFAVVNVGDNGDVSEGAGHKALPEIEKESVGQMTKLKQNKIQQKMMQNCGRRWCPIGRRFAGKATQ
ncbi:MAG: hypothetical protein IPJ25_03565 [Rhodocyclaceae bacterium]|nr:hypothetical protein [Rhodocyclaceae bacterium]